MSSSDAPSSPVDASGFAYVVGIDMGSQAYVYSVLQPDKRPVGKPTELANNRAGFEQLHGCLRQLGVAPERVLIGLEATSRYSENLYQFLSEQGYPLCLLHPRQTHQFAQQRGLRAKTDRLDATTIARLLLSGEARRGYVPDELIATYREVARLHSQLADDSARYQNQIQALLVVLFPEFVQVFADPCRPTALALLKRYRSRPGHRRGPGGGAHRDLASAGSAPLWAPDRPSTGAPGVAVGRQWPGDRGALAEFACAV